MGSMTQKKDTPPLSQTRAAHVNRQRTKTAEQIAREFKHLNRIEAALAKERKAAAAEQTNRALGRKANQDTLSPNSDGASGRADDAAAKALGIGRDTARKMEAVVDAIDEAEAEGDAQCQ